MRAGGLHGRRGIGEVGKADDVQLARFSGSISARLAARCAAYLCLYRVRSHRRPGIGGPTAGGAGFVHSVRQRGNRRRLLTQYN